MHESHEQLKELQRLLDETYDQAGSHYRSIHTPKRRMSAEEVCALLTGVTVFDLGTVSERSRPYVAPVDGLFLAGTLWFSSGRDSVRFRHIRRNAYVSAAYSEGETISIMLHGIAHEVDTSKPGFEQLHDYCLEVYGSTYDSWGLWGKSPFAWIEPTSMYASRPGESRE